MYNIIYAATAAVARLRAELYALTAACAHESQHTPVATIHGGEGGGDGGGGDGGGGDGGGEGGGAAARRAAHAARRARARASSGR